MRYSSLFLIVMSFFLFNFCGSASKSVEKRGKKSQLSKVSKENFDFFGAGVTFFDFVFNLEKSGKKACNSFLAKKSGYGDTFASFLEKIKEQCNDKTVDANSLKSFVLANVNKFTQELINNEGELDFALFYSGFTLRKIYIELVVLKQNQILINEYQTRLKKIIEIFKEHKFKEKPFSTVETVYKAFSRGNIADIKRVISSAFKS